MSTSPRLYSLYDGPMWESIAQDGMRIQRCAQCGTFRYPPGACCPACLSTEATWEPVSGSGRVLSWTTFHRQYLPAYPAPTTVVAVQLAEGPIVLSNIDQADVPRLRLDAPAELFYDTHPDGFRLPRFRLIEDGPA